MIGDLKKQRYALFFSLVLAIPLILLLTIGLFPQLTGMFASHNVHFSETVSVNTIYTSENPLNYIPLPFHDNYLSIRISGSVSGTGDLIIKSRDANNISKTVYERTFFPLVDSGNLITALASLEIDLNETLSIPKEEKIKKLNKTEVLPVVPVNMSINITDDDFVDMFEDVISFSDECQESCSDLNQDNVTLEIILSGNLTFFLEDIKYVYAEVLKQIQDIPDYYIQQSKLSAIDLKPFFIDSDDIYFDVPVIPELNLSIVDDRFLYVYSDTLGSYPVFVYAGIEDEVIVSEVFEIIVSNEDIYNESLLTTSGTIVDPEIYSVLQSEDSVRVLITMEPQGEFFVLEDSFFTTQKSDNGQGLGQDKEHKSKLKEEKDKAKKLSKKEKDKLNFTNSTELDLDSSLYLDVGITPPIVVKQLTTDYLSADISLQQLDQLIAQENIIEIKIDRLITSFTEESLNITKITDVHNLGYGGEGSVICLLDTGINPNAIDMNESLIVGYNFLNDSAVYYDDNGHGTSTGYLAYAGAPNASFVVGKVLDETGQGYSSDVIAGLEFCAQQNATVVSLSLGEGSYSGYCDEQPVAQKVNEIYSQGIFVVAATGNDGSSFVIKNPACASGALAVGASTKFDSIALLSDYNGKTLLVAPGENINAVDANGNPLTVSGTSLSVPFVSAAAAILQSYDSSLTVSEISDRLIHTGDLIEYDLREFSRLNVLNAINNNITNNLFVNFSSLGNESNSTGNFSGQALAITNCTDLQNVNNNLTTSYVLSNDIDCSASAGWNSGAGFIPIGRTSPYFTGTFNGQGHTISGLAMNRGGESFTAFIGRSASASEVSNVFFENVSIVGASYTGAVIGYSSGSGNFANIQVTGTVTGTTYVGGFGGYLSNAAIDITDSAAYVDVTCTTGANCGGFIGRFNYGEIYDSAAYGDVTSVHGYMGGFIGYMYSGVEIYNSFSVGDVLGTTANSDSVGGFVGRSDASTNVISDCYARGDVNASLGDSVGGFVGYHSVGSINNSYSTATTISGATNFNCFRGSGSATTNNNFFDDDVCTATDGTGATSKTTAQMKTESTFTTVGWDFTTDWTMIGYPKFHGLQTCFELQTMQADLEDDYQLDNDIDCEDTNNWNAGQGFSPIAFDSTNRFNGSLQGQQYLIKNIFINRTEAYKSSMFGLTWEGSSFDNFSIVDYEIYADNAVAGSNYAAPLVSSNKGDVSYVSAIGDIEGTANTRYITGLMGYNGAGDVSNCFSAGSFYSGTYGGGGFTGYTSLSGTISDSFSLASIVAGSSTTYASGFVSRLNLNSVVDSYSAGYGFSGVNGFVGQYISGSVTTSYFDSTTSGQSDSYATAKTTLQMQTQSSFTGFDFTNTWFMDGYYPMLYGFMSLDSNVYNTSNALNTTIENLSLTTGGASRTGLINVSDWKLNGSSIAVLNMPLERVLSTYQNKRARDYSSFANDGVMGAGTSSAEPTYVDGCQVGNCMSFDGGDYIEIANDASLNPPSELTLSAWIKVAETSSVKPILAKPHNWSASEKSYLLRINPDDVELYMAQSDNTQVGGSFSDLTVDTNWHHVVVTMNGSKIEAYLDGVKSSTSYTYDGTIQYTPGNFWVGHYSSYYFSGSIDEVQILNHSLSYEQINASYADGVAGRSVETIVSQETFIGDNWSVKVVPNNGYFDGDFWESENITVLTDNEAPVTEMANITPASPTTFVDIEGWCNATDANGDNLTYYWQWYVDGALNETGNTAPTNYTQGVAVNVNNITSGNTSSGENWTFSCLADDGSVNSSWLNSSNATITYPYGCDPTNPTAFTGLGTSGSPYQITDCCQLQAMETSLSSSYKIMNYINCSNTTLWNSGDGFDPVGDNSIRFTGNLEGDGNIISDLFIDRSSVDFVGLFGIFDSGNISNVGLTNVNITGDYYTGSLVGRLYGTVNSSFSTGTVTGGRGVGGLVGQLCNAAAFINNSYSSADVIGEGGMSPFGVCVTSYVYDSYSAGNITGGNYYLEGLVGADGSSITSFWDNETTDLTNTLGTGKPTANMQHHDQYWDIGWDINCSDPNSIWGINDTFDYPCLMWEADCTCNWFDSPDPNLVYIVPAPNATNSQDLVGYCNVSDTDSSTVFYNWIWYVGGSAYSSGSTSPTTYPVGTVQAVDTLDSSSTAPGQTWIFSCSAGDGLVNGSYLNSSGTLINNNAPNVGYSNVTPEDTALDAEDLFGYCNYTDPDDDPLFYYFQWYVDGVANASGFVPRVWDFPFDGNSGDDVVNDIVTDQFNDMYVVGYGSNLISGSSGKDYWIKKFTYLASEDTTWNFTFHVGNNDEAKAVDVDELNHSVYVAAQHSTSDDAILYLKKYDFNGTEYNVTQGWNKSFVAGTGSGYVSDVVVDSQQNVYFTAYSLEGTLLCKIKKFYPNGTEIISGWNKSLELGSSQSCKKLALDSNDNLYFSGSGENLVGPSTNDDGYLVKYNSAGTQQWNESFDDGQTVSALAVDSSDNIYLGLSASNLFNASSGLDLWIKKYSGAGSEISSGWNKTINHDNDGDVFAEIKVDSNDNLFVGSYSENLVGGATLKDWWVKKFSSAGVENTTEWNKTFNGVRNGHDIATTLTINTNDEVYISGAFQNEIGVSTSYDWMLLNMTQAFPSGVEVMVSGIPNQETSPGENWTMECMAYDGVVNATYASNDSTIIAGPPEMVMVNITPASPTVSEDLQGWCNATDFDGDNVTYYWQWYVNGTLNETGNTAPTNYTQGLAVNVNNLTSGNTTIGENWTFACLAEDIHGNSSWMNSSNVTIIYQYGCDPTNPTAFTGAGTGGDPYQITDCCQLQAMNTSLSSFYKLMNNVSCINTTYWNSGAGFVPVGATSGSFTGSFNGQNYTIDELYINRTGSETALFGYKLGTSYISDFTMDNANITGGVRTSVVLAWVGNSGISMTNVHVNNSHVVGSGQTSGHTSYCNQAGSVTDCTVSNTYVESSSQYTAGFMAFSSNGIFDNITVTNVTVNNTAVGHSGGVFGAVQTSVSNLVATDVDVICNGNRCGGLIGYAVGTLNITNTSATGTMRSFSSSTVNYFGGLVGDLNIGSGYLNNSWADVFVNLSVGTYAGGLVGKVVGGNIYDSYTLGDVEGPSYIGGVTGGINVGTINNVSADGTFDAVASVGGLVGNLAAGANLFNSETTSNVVVTASGLNSYAGLLVGSQVGISENNTARGSVTGLFYDGGCAGIMSGGYIKNCVSEGNISGYYYGGIVGRMTAGEVNDSIFSGNVDGYYYGGGLVGIMVGGSFHNFTSTGVVRGTQNIGGIAGSIGFATTIEDLSFSGLNVTATSTISYVGGFVGSAGHADLILRNISINDSTVLGLTRAGGFVGNFGSGAILNCSTNNVTVTGADYTGGFVGVNEGTINGSAVHDSNMISNAGNSVIGGFVGSLSGSIYDSYVSGNVTGANLVGGFAAIVSTGSITNSYTKVNATCSGSPCGAFVGSDTSGTYTANFFDNETTDVTTDSFATAKPTANMKHHDQYYDASWDIDCSSGTSIWGINDTFTYPCLMWEDGCVDACYWLDSPDPNLVYIVPSPNATNSQDLVGYCNVSDTDSSTVYYNWIWYVNGVESSTGTTSPTTYPVGTVQAVDTLDSSSTAPGQTWIFSCSAGDGLVNGSYLNSSGTLINNNAPNVGYSNVTPEDTALDAEDLFGYCNYTDPDDDPLFYYFQWYVDGVANASGFVPRVWDFPFDGNVYDDYISDIVTDQFNDMYVVGYGNNLVSGSSGSDIWIKKFNYLAGEDSTWNFTFDEGAVDRAYSVDVDELNHSIYVGSQYISGNIFWYLKKYDYNGTEYNATQGWNKTLDTETNRGYFSDLAVDSQQNIYFMGKYFEGGYVCKIKKFYPNGTEIITGWNKSLVFENNNDCQDIALDSSDNLYFGGMGYNIINSSSTYDAILIKYNSAGVQQWNKSYDDAARVEAIATDSSDNVYVGMAYTGLYNASSVWDLWIKKFNSVGTEITSGWNKTINHGEESEYFAEMQVDSNDKLYVGARSDNLVGAATLTDWWIKQYNSDGTENTTAWNKSFNGLRNGNDVPNTLTINTNDEVYIAGAFENEVGVSTRLDWMLMNTTQAFPSGVEVLVSGIPNQETSPGENWTMECMAFDGAVNATAASNDSTIIVSIPVVTTGDVWIVDSPTSWNNESLQGWCNGTDVDGDNVTYYWQWYVNGTLNETGNTAPTNYTQGVEVNVNNISIGYLLVDQNWTFSCLAGDGIYNSSWFNSTNTTINQSNEAPVVSNVILNSTLGTNFTDENLTVYYTASDVNGDALTNITDWRKDDVSIVVLNLPFDTNEVLTTADAVRDYSTYKNNGTISSVDNWTDSCQVGGCYGFDGSGNYMTVADDASLNFGTKNFTIMMWLNVINSASNEGILTKGYIGAYGVFHTPATDLVSLYIQSGSVFNGVSITSYYDQWIHVAWTVDSSGDLQNSYLNGVFDHQTNNLVGTVTSAFDLNIGRYTTTGAGYYSGLVDEVQLFDTMLTPEQINLSYQAGLLGKHVESFNSEETFVGDNWTACVTPNDGAVDGNTLCSNWLEIVDGFYLTYNNSFVNYSDAHAFNVSAGVYIVSGAANILDTFINSSNGTCDYLSNSSSGNYFNVTYNCTGTPFVYNNVSLIFTDGTENVSSAFSLNDYPNVAPGLPTLIEPTDGNTTVHDIRPLFNWTTVTDHESDTFNYTINVSTTIICPALAVDIVQNTTFSNYTHSADFCTSATEVYEWKVRACDTWNCSAWTAVWNFTLEPYVEIVFINATPSALSNDTVDFGTVNPNDSYNTTSGIYSPFRIRNEGNTVADLLNLSAQSSLWVASGAGLGTDYMEIKARNTTSEPSSFVSASSIMDWTNLTSTNLGIIGELNFSTSADEALIDLRITVPNSEPPGAKTSTIILSWEETP